jgi:hypothetical protein
MILPDNELESKLTNKLSEYKDLEMNDKWIKTKSHLAHSLDMSKI